jgi:hypothetical protein
MAYVSAELRSKIEDPKHILSFHTDLIKELYEEALAQTLEEEETQEESIATICTVIALCFLNDKENIEFPLPYEEGEESLIVEIADAVNFILTLEALVDKGTVSKKIVKGKALYSGEQPKKKKKKKR